MDICVKSHNLVFMPERTTSEKVCTGRDLAATRSKVKLSPKEFAAWRRDLKKARKILKAPTDKWR
jgi:hypothetical protein